MATCKYIHEFTVSSGKGQRTITKVYEEAAEAHEKHLLLGGNLELVEVLREFKKSTVTGEAE